MVQNIVLCLRKELVFKLQMLSNSRQNFSLHVTIAEAHKAANAETNNSMSHEILQCKLRDRWSYKQIRLRSPVPLSFLATQATLNLNIGN